MARAREVIQRLRKHGIEVEPWGATLPLTVLQVTRLLDLIEERGTKEQMQRDIAALWNRVDQLNQIQVQQHVRIERIEHSPKT